MLNIGMTELFCFAIIALLVLGPEKLPEGARFAGKWYGKIKRMISNVQNDLDRELRISDLRAQMQQEMSKIQELEQKMQAQINAIENQRIDSPQKVNQPAMVYTFIQQPFSAYPLSQPKVKVMSKLHQISSSTMNPELKLLKVAV